MKRLAAIVLTAIFMLSFAACGAREEESSSSALPAEPEMSQMKSICELSVMECYYHNVAKFFQEDAEGILFWKKDKHFWIEYSGVVRLGIDASLVSMEVSGSQVVITIPQAKVLGCKVDSASLTEDSYIVAKDSADITAEDEVIALEEAQRQLEENAAGDRALLSDAQQRAMGLLEDYITNLGEAVGVDYTVKWIELDADGNPISGSASDAQTESSESRDTADSSETGSSSEPEA